MAGNENGRLGRYERRLILGKDEILSKLNVKNYGNALERIIDKKAFDLDTKNLLLSMFYKIEAAFDDYHKVKVDVKPKKEFIEELLKIIEHDCESIYLTSPTKSKEEINIERRAIEYKQEKKVISYPNERDLTYAIYNSRKE